MKKLTRTRLWHPDYIVGSVLELDADELRGRGITHLVFDLDNTLLPHGTSTVAPKSLAKLRHLKRAGLTLLVGSNTRRDIELIITALEVVAVRPIGVSMKPLHSFYRRVIAAADTTPEHIAMVGDHPLNDVLGGNRAGLTTILVTGFYREHLSWQRVYLRLIERRP